MFLEHCSCSRLRTSFISLRQLPIRPLVGRADATTASFVQRHSPIHSEIQSISCSTHGSDVLFISRVFGSQETLIGEGKRSDDGRCSSSDMVCTGKTCQTACLVALLWADCGVFR